MRVLKSLRKDKRGAVLAEFIIAIVPILAMFFNFLQLAHLATARLVVKHGAIVGARAAAVMTNGHDNTPDQKGKGVNESEIKQGVMLAMANWVAAGSLTNPTVNITDTSSYDDPYNWVTVEVKATYHCDLPMAPLACGGSRTKELVETKRMPHQGANYK
jgi:Flp pilus assembly protein TadG